MLDFEICERGTISSTKLSFHQITAYCCHPVWLQCGSNNFFYVEIYNYFFLENGRMNWLATQWLTVPRIMSQIVPNALDFTVQLSITKDFLDAAVWVFRMSFISTFPTPQHIHEKSCQNWILILHRIIYFRPCWNSSLISSFLHTKCWSPRSEKKLALVVCLFWRPAQELS